MSFKILTTHRFEKELKRLIKKFPSLKFEFVELIKTLSNNENTGTSIGNNCYKIRLSILSKGKGKSGGGRVISYVYIQSQTIYLLTIYDKGEKSNITSVELKELIESLVLD